MREHCATLPHPAAVFQHSGFAEGDQGIKELRQAFFPGAFAFEVGGEVVEGERGGGCRQCAGDCGDLVGELLRPWLWCLCWLRCGRG